MSTTTIRLTDELKSRIALAASRSGTTAHAFILEAIAEKAEHAERRAEMEQTAEERYAAIVERGKTVPWSEMRAYLVERARGASPKKPRPRRVAR